MAGEARFSIEFKPRQSAVADLAGMDWWNSFSHVQRRGWMRQAGNIARVVDAWKAYKH